MNTATDTLRRDDLTPSAHSAFDALPEGAQTAFRRAASRGTANLADDFGEGWIMVPSKRGLRQVAYSGRRAYRL